MPLQFLRVASIEDYKDSHKAAAIQKISASLGGKDCRCTEYHIAPLVCLFLIYV